MKTRPDFSEFARKLEKMRANADTVGIHLKRVRDVASAIKFNRGIVAHNNKTTPDTTLRVVTKKVDIDDTVIKWIENERLHSRIQKFQNLKIGLRGSSMK